MLNRYTAAMSPFAAPALPEEIGAYKVERLLAAGGMGEVLLAWDDGLGRPVAIKRLRPGWLS